MQGVVVAAHPRAGDEGGVKPGDRVFGLATGSLGSHVVASDRTLVGMPPNITFEQAATTPTVFITIDAVFGHAAALRRGETVLVPAAAGGVGLAALQVVATMGAEAIATAGNPSKRALLRQLGVQHVAGSRDIAFAEVAAQLGGVDVVLNTLTSPGMVAATASVLRLGGRFLEISKRDIWSPGRLQQERPDVAYGFVAVDFMPERALHAAMLRLAAMLARRALTPLPNAVHDVANAAAALRQMSQARHVGKVVVGHAAYNSQPLSGPSSVGSAVMVVGGTGTLGTLVAGWLADLGVRHISLLSRTGKATPASARLLSGGSGGGSGGSSASCQAQVSLVQCDASLQTDVERVAEGLGVPLLAVMHAGAWVQGSGF